MFIDMYGMGTGLSKDGWNQKSGQASEYTLSNNNFRTWRPDVSVTPGSGGLLLSCKIDHDISGEDNHGVLMLWFNQKAELTAGQFDILFSDNTSATSGLVTGSDPDTVGGNIRDNVTSSAASNHKSEANLLGQAANYSVGAICPSIYFSCKIENVNAPGKVLDVGHGTNAQIWDYNGSSSQQWRLIPARPDAWIIISVASTKVLDVTGGGTGNGPDIEQWEYLGQTNQQWQLMEVGGNAYYIVSVNSGKNVAVSGGATANGSGVIQYQNTSRGEQQWKFLGLR